MFQGHTKDTILTFDDLYNECMFKRVGEKNFKKIAFWGTGFILLLTVFFAAFIPSIKFDYDFEKFFPIDDEETAYFFEHRDKFESDNDFLLIAIERKEGVFNERFLRDVETFRKELLDSVPHVKLVQGVTNIEEQFIFPGGGSSRRPYIDLSSPDLKRDSIRIYRSEELINVFLAEDAKSLCLFLKHEDYISKKKSDKVIDGVKRISEKYPFEKVRVAGRVIGQKYYITKMVYELVLFVGLSAFLIIIFLLIAFRSGWGILIPQFVIFASLAWVLGSMGLFGQPMNIVLITLPSIMFVVGMSDVIHLVSRYLDALRTGLSKFEAIRVAVREIGFATFLTSLTTAIGFFSLYFVKVQPIQIFGIVVGIGVIIAFILTFVSLPFLFILFPSPKYIYRSKESSFWSNKLRAWFQWIIRSPWKIILAYSLLAIISVMGTLMIRTNNFLMDDLRSSEPLKKDFDYLDAHYGGVRPFELVAELKDTNDNLWSLDNLNDLEEVEQYLTDTYGVTIKSSLVHFAKVINRSSNAGNPDKFELPESNSKMRAIKRGIRIANGGKLYSSVVDSAGLVLRISGTIPDWGNEEVTRRNKKLERFLKGRDSMSPWKFKITGTAHLFDKNLRYLATSLVQGLLVSVLIVAMIMGFIYRSFSMVLISIIPNIFPLIAIAGIMGFTGIELKTSTSIIFTIAFGIAVDDTIHLLGKFKFELMKGRSKIYALKRAYLTTGKAMILTTLILCSGFLLLVFSSFMGTFHMGLLLCITLMVALVADLTLLPVLILLFYRKK
ncbi:MAG: hypothetical protein EP305_08620 [Bacteroidetes bacterium]|nr:MAG: hypothetical protein EP305_08620 [Bacteroidota bacterium]